MPETPARPITRFDDGVVTRVIDHLTEEEPLEVRVRGRSIGVTMRTPGDDEDLAVGFLLTEGIVRKPADVLRVEPCTRNDFGNVINVLLAPDVHVDFDRLTRHVFASSSCGLCGKSSVEAVRGNFPAVSSTWTVDAGVILSLPDKMRPAQSSFDRTGGLHAACLFSPGGDLLVTREDVGRHNAVDKVIGHAVRSGSVPTRDCVLMVSGRTSFEIVQKAVAAGIPVVASVSAPSSLAVDFANEVGITLIGFVRGGRMNVYTGAGRVVLAGVATLVATGLVLANDGRPPQPRVE
jgi:FdhD protein